MAYRATLDEDEFNRLAAAEDTEGRRIDVAPTQQQRLHGFDAVCLMLNRTIGSAIFVVPTRILNGVGSSGAALLVWVLCGLISICGILVWLEFGLSVPLRLVPGSGGVTSVPRSGGEKNYFEFIFRRYKFLATSLYGIPFILLGNLSGNGIAFGIYVLKAAGRDASEQKNVIGIAIFALTVCIVLHIFSRRGGILLNNVLAVFKIILLLIIFGLGVAKAKGAHLGGAPVTTGNFDTKESFSASTNVDTPGVVGSMIFCLYAYSGFQQPFYVLSEFAAPRKTFPRYTLLGGCLALVLFLLTNIGYLCAVPRISNSGDEGWLHNTGDMATLFFGAVFGNEDAKRAMHALVAMSILGNILVMTFTAARVKQEIAKEGLLPFSLFFATAHDTPFARLGARLRGKKAAEAAYNANSHLEQSPIAALGLHWFFSLVLVAATVRLSPLDAYKVLTRLYTYVLVIGMGAIVSAGLIYIKLARNTKWDGVHWRNIPRKFEPWISPMHAVVYFVICTFLLYASFAKPYLGSPFYYVTGSLKWYLVPAIGQSAWLWGLIYYGGLRLVEWWRSKQLVVERITYIERDEDDPSQWIQKGEVVTHDWHTRGRSEPRETEFQEVHNLDELDMYDPIR